MGKRTPKPELSSVMFSYVGNDTQFDAFLNMLIHDYFAVDNPFVQAEEQQIVGLVWTSMKMENKQSVISPRAMILSG